MKFAILEAPKQAIALLLCIASLGGFRPLYSQGTPDSIAKGDSLAASVSSAIEQSLEKAGANRAEIEKALRAFPTHRGEGMKFLVENMPERDLKSLKGDFLIEQVRLAYDSFEKAPWKEAVPSDVFLNNVLPYAVINERRDPWRADFIDRFAPVVESAKTPGEAAAILNQKIFGMLKVKYSTSRKKADQSPLESIDSGLASCSGLSVLLIDACRAVGVPARFVGTPMWTDNSGNHSWVEVWDEGAWHFTGAAEPSGDKLDQAWFIGRAGGSLRDDPDHAIYATSFLRTPTKFPLVWDRSIDYVFAVNVTDRYLQAAKPIPAGYARVHFLVVAADTGKRLAAPIQVFDEAGAMILEGRSNDERFDANDHIHATLKESTTARVEVEWKNQKSEVNFRVEKMDQLIRIELKGTNP